MPPLAAFSSAVVNRRFMGNSFAFLSQKGNNITSHRAHRQTETNQGSNKAKKEGAFL